MNKFKLLIVFSLLGFALAACGSNSESAEENSSDVPSEIEQGIVPRENSAVYSNLSVNAERIVENYEGIERPRIDNSDIEITKLQNATDVEGNEYTNSFGITGTFSHEGELHDFSTQLDFNENNMDSSMSILFYMSSKSGKILDVEME